MVMLVKQVSWIPQEHKCVVTNTALVWDTILTTRSGWQPILHSLWIGFMVVELIGWEFVLMG